VTKDFITTIVKTSAGAHGCSVKQAEYNKVTNRKWLETWSQ